MNDHARVCAPALLLAQLLLAGCLMSVQEIRTSGPGRIGVVRGAAIPLAGCVAEGLQVSPRGDWLTEPGDLIYQVLQRPEEQRASVTGYLSGAPYPAPLIDLSFYQVGDDVRIESRWGRLQGADNESATTRGARRIDARVWPIVERCSAGASIQVTPPTIDPADRR